MAMNPAVQEEHPRLYELVSEAAKIIRENPEMKIDRIAINQHGVHTFHRVPGVPASTL